MIVKALPFTQGKNNLLIFSAPAKSIWDVVQINKKTDDKDDGYQRALSPSRAQSVKRFVEDGNVIAPAIIIAFDAGKATYDEQTSELTIDDVPDAGWVIDGQHRLRGAELAASNIELAVVAFLDLDLEKQIQQFVTINKEAKGVPTSLYYDLLNQLPHKKNHSEIAKEKTAAIAEQLRKNKDSIFYERIVVVTAPKNGELSLTNFVRKISPMLVYGKGSLAAYSQQEVTQILENYFCALKEIFPDEFSPSKQRFFKTLGFGAACNALHTIFSHTLREKQGFSQSDVASMLEKIEDFNFSDWDNVGSGTAAEKQAGQDLESYFEIKIKDNEEHTGKLRL